MPVQHDPTQALHFVAVFFAIYAVVFAVILTAVIIPSWFICKKAGFSPWLAFLIIIPFGGVVLLYVLAFAEWKVVPVSQAALPPYPQAPFPPVSPTQSLPPQA